MPIEPLTITAAAPLIRSGELTPSELLEQCLRRVDLYEPHVHAWVHLDRERARRDAEVLTDEVKRGQYRGALHGIPIGIKDIIDVADMPTACGSKLWQNSYARQDAPVVARLRQAGAIILGKTVTTAYAFLDPPITRNPWNLDRTPGGSSSGSAAAVACGMCLGALGSQTGGSLTRPASYCGVCSLKPSYGRVSVEGVLPLAPSLDHIGVMANCVRDLAHLYECIAGADGRVVNDAFGRRYPENEEPDYDHFSIYDRTEDFGIEGVDPLIANAIHEFSRRLSKTIPVANRTVEIEPKRLPPSFSEVLQHHAVIMAVEAAAVHQERFRRHPEDYPPKITDLIQRGLATAANEFANAQQHQKQLIADLRKRFRYLIQPATTCLPPGSETTGNAMMNAPWSYTGLPTVSFPIEWNSGLPLAVQIVSKAGWEDELICVAAWCEQVVGRIHRLPPVPA